MKSALINFSIFVGVLFLTLFLAFMTPLSNVYEEVPPPEKTARHLELEKMSGYSRSEMDELWSEREQFQQRWKNKASQKTISTSASFEIIVDRMQIPFGIAISLFALFFKWRSILDSTLVLIALALFSLIFPIIQINTLIYSVVIISLASFYKAAKFKKKLT